MGSDAMAETITKMKAYVEQRTGHSNKALGMYFASSYWNSVPNDKMIAASDFVLLHGNDQSPSDVQNMIDSVRSSSAYRSNPMPIVFNEDPNTDFDKSSNNMHSAVLHHASWGYYAQGTNDYKSGYQSPPVDWGVDTDDKKAFFEQVRNYTI